MLKGMYYVKPEEFSIAQRMSWASKRVTTRVEDIAYSLLGLFGVNMPMLYGEGERAFTRLQEEIMKHSDDHSLFVWSNKTSGYRGLLAKSPADFEGCSKIVQIHPGLNQKPFKITNMGLSIELPVVPWAMETYVAALDCEVEGGKNSRIGIFLKLFSRRETNHLIRVSMDKKDRIFFDGELIQKSHFRKMYVKQSYWGTSPPMGRLYGFRLRTLPDNITVSIGWGDEYNLCQIDSRSQRDGIVEIPRGCSGTAGVFWWESKGGVSLREVLLYRVMNRLLIHFFLHSIPF